jgi:hypothetical protein
MLLFRCNGISISDLLCCSKDHWTANAENFTSNGIVFNEKEQLRIRGEALAGWHIVLVTSQVMCFTMKTISNISKLVSAATEKCNRRVKDRTAETPACASCSLYIYTYMFTTSKLSHALLMAEIGGEMEWRDG